MGIVCSLRLQVVVIGVAAALFAACSRTDPAAGSGGAERAFAVTGIVRAPLENGQVVIEHEEIPDFMPAMTMAFYVQNETEAARLRAGDRVTFRFIVGETSRATDFVITGREPTPAAGGPPHESGRSTRLRVGDRLPDFALVDQENETFTNADLQDHHTVLTFIFTRCPVPEFCPAMTRRFSTLQDQIAGDPALRHTARLLSISIDPEFDRPSVLREYGEASGADFGRWKFVTGSTPEIDRLARAFAVYREHNGVTLDHTLTTALIGPDGRVLELWRGNGWTVDEVTAALHRTIAGG